MIRWVDFSAVKQAVSLEAVLRHYQIPGLRRHRDQLQGCCPIHRGRRDDSFRAHLTKNIFQCFACQARGTVLDFVAAMEQCSIREAALRLQQWFGVCASGLRLYPAAAGRQKGTGSERRREQPSALLRSGRCGKESSVSGATWHRSGYRRRVWRGSLSGAGSDEWAHRDSDSQPARPTGRLCWSRPG